MIRTAFSTNGSLASNSTNLLPADFSWGAFKRVFGMQSTEEALAEGGSGAAIDFWVYLRNSILFSTVTTASQVFFSALAAYAFARLRWPGRDKVFALFLATMMIPGIFTALPNFLLIKNLGLLNTFAGLTLPFLFMSIFAIFFLRQFFLSMSREVEEAAMLDGAEHLAHLLPDRASECSRPARHPPAADVRGAWNDYLWPLLVATTRTSGPHRGARRVPSSQSPQGAPDWTGLMAATILAVLPVRHPVHRLR